MEAWPSSLFQKLPLIRFVKASRWTYITEYITNVWSYHNFMKISWIICKPLTSGISGWIKVCQTLFSNLIVWQTFETDAPDQTPWVKQISDPGCIRSSKEGQLQTVVHSQRRLDYDATLYFVVVCTEGWGGRDPGVLLLLWGQTNPLHKWGSWLVADESRWMSMSTITSKDMGTNHFIQERPGKATWL